MLEIDYEIQMILKLLICNLKEFWQDPVVRKTVFWIASLAAFSAQFAAGWLVSTDHNQQLGIVGESMTRTEAFEKNRGNL